ncbi:MAG: aminotransferase class V-fold PLP-dependent enzyme [Bdellovibrionales bacterium]|nr:aminotransferase class V-fold PLP-dependent enzyme [Bdellovibrionales bacterium]
MNYKSDGFNIPDHVTYLNCAYMSPFLKSTSKIGQSAVLKKEKPWEIQGDDFFQPVEEARSRFARLVHAKSENIAIVPSASYGLATAAKNLSGLPAGKILLIGDQFPSNVYVWRELAKSDRHEIVYISKNISESAGENISDKIIRELDKDVRIVAMSHVHWCDGLKFDLKRISSDVQKRNIKLVIDGTQSIGAIPFSVEEIRPDFLITACYKWLFGPYAMGFMYVSEDFLEGTPLEFNWINKLGSNDFQNLVNYKDQFEPGARRYDMGERSQFHAMPMVVDALKFIEDVGVQNISHHCEDLIEFFISNLEPLGAKVRYWDKEQRSENIFGLYFESDQALQRVKENLMAHHCFVSYRGQSMRISPHVYNSKEDMVTLFGLIQQVL